MNKRPLSILLNALIMALFIVAAVLLAQGSRPSQAAPGTPPTAAGESPALAAGNTCASCHVAEIPLTAKDWAGGIAHTASSPCPAYVKIQEELYYTERLLLLIERGQSDLTPDATRSARLNAGYEGYARLLDAPITSLDAFTSEAQNLRYRLGKVYTAINQTIDQQKRDRSLIAAVAVSLLLALSLGWGWVNTRRFQLRAQARPSRMALAGRGLILLLVFAMFALPLLREPPTPATASTAEAQAAQTALDTATRAAAATERGQARAWMLSQTAAAWQPLDAAQADNSLALALDSAAMSGRSAEALWGAAALAQESATGEHKALEKAGLAARQVTAARGRAWGLALMAKPWRLLDPARATALLEQARLQSAAAEQPYRDLDRRSIAVLYAQLDPARALAIAAEIDDPALRAWGLREIGVYDTAAFDKAAAAARQIGDPLEQALALARIGAAANNPKLLDEARSLLDAQPEEALSDARLAFALADLAGLAHDPALAQTIPTQFPEARTLALLNSGDLPGALEASAGIADPYEQGRAQLEIVRRLAATDPAAALQAGRAIRQPNLRQHALTALIQISADPAALPDLSLPYYQMQALTALNRLPEAVSLAGALKDGYPLIALAATLAQTDPNGALALVDAMPREADRAEALWHIVQAHPDPATIERALKMAQAARVRGDALAPARLSLRLANWLAIQSQIPPTAWESALQQAQRLAEGISTK